ncbi:transmembrane amino acid transporter protein [Ancylostoma ceylanicum]|uniref:Transmembrane amino acid transporter protein n=2 Tax=Ancylostoma TaxID=29169 RepID=A0A0D6M886_9BILA|nr:transmembrane amino acid transporter protein [Ancylostoma ceylanicum]
MAQRLQTLQDWSNKHVFTASMDYWNQDPPEVESYDMRRQRTVQRQPNYGTVEEGPEGENASPTEISDVIEEDPHAGGEPITALQAAWNVTNAIQGMFIVGLPIAVKVGGWWSVAAMMGVAYICYWTGVLLIECLYEKEKKVRYSYREVAEFYRPGFGKWVLAAQLTELLSTCIIYLVLAADLLQSCFPSIVIFAADKPAWMMIVSAVLLACAFLDSLVVVSQLSFANAISHLAVNAIMMIYCLSEVRSWSFSSVTFGLDIYTLPTMIGVVVFGYTSHIFLPSLEGNMKEPKEFKWMLKWSHVAAALFKAIFGLCGYLTFGELTQPEISNSLPNQGFKVIVNLVLVIKALLSYPLPFYAAVQLLKDNLFRGTKHTPFTGCYSPDGSLREWALFLRILLLLFTLFIALSVPYLIELMGLIGNITGTMLSFIWPALFHLRIKGDKMVDRDRRFDQMIIGLGCSICVSGVYFSFMELLRAIRADDR